MLPTIVSASTNVCLMHSSGSLLFGELFRLYLFSVSPLNALVFVPGLRSRLLPLSDACTLIFVITRAWIGGMFCERHDRCS